MKNNKTGTDKTGLTNPLKKAFEVNKGGKLFLAALFLVFLGVPLSSVKATATTVQTVNQEALAVNKEALAVNQENLSVNQEALAVNKEVQAVNQETLAVNQENLSANKAVQAVNKDIQKLIAKQLKSTFKQTTFTNLEPAPVNFWYQAEVNNQVVYFSPTQALIFLVLPLF